MLRIVICLSLAGFAVGCGPSKIRSYEGHACSVDEGDDPQRTCSPTSDLVCINTYAVEVTNRIERLKWDGGRRPVWLCRLACSPGEGCTGGEVCCPGTIWGKTYDKTHACVPAQFCETPKSDAGAVRRDASGEVGADAQVDAPPDAASLVDAAVDAVSAPDAPVDAPAAPDGADASSTD